MVLKLCLDHYKNKDTKILRFHITLVTYCKLLNHNEMDNQLVTITIYQHTVVQKRN